MFAWRVLVVVFFFGCLAIPCLRHDDEGTPSFLCAFGKCETAA